jgi:hypothetical protein
MKRYQIYVTLTDVPANAEDLIMNATLGGPNSIYSQFKTVSTPSEGEVVKFVFKVPSGGGETGGFICGEQATSGISSCEQYSLPSTGSGPIRVDYSYPT